MSDHPARTALVAALRDRRRNLAALAVVAVAFGSAAVLSSDLAFYAAWLATFTVWMAWFMLVAIEWIQRADF